MSELQFIPSVKPGAYGTPNMAMEDIPDEVKKDVEEAYNTLKQYEGRLRVKKATAADLAVYTNQIKSYCEQRPEGKLRFRRSPTKGLPSNEMEFRITDPKTDDGNNTNEIREAVENVKASAKSK